MPVAIFSLLLPEIEYRASIRLITALKTALPMSAARIELPIGAAAVAAYLPDADARTLVGIVTLNADGVRGDYGLLSGKCCRDTTAQRRERCG